MTGLVLLALVGLLAGFIQGLAGFGSALVALPLFSLLVGVKSAVPLATLVGLVVSVINAASLRRVFVSVQLKFLLLGAVFGLPVGTFFLSRVDERAVALPIALILIGLPIFNFLRTPRVTKGWSHPAVSFVGFVSGALGGAFSTNGPPVLVYLAMQDWEADRKKALLTWFFLISGGLTAISHWLSGLSNLTTLTRVAHTIPCVVVGTLCGIWLYRRSSNRMYGLIANVLIFAMGCVMLLRFAGG